MTPELLLFLSPVSEEGHPTSSSHVPVGASPGLLFLMTIHSLWKVIRVDSSSVCLFPRWRLPKYLWALFVWRHSGLLFWFHFCCGLSPDFFLPHGEMLLEHQMSFFCLFFYWENAGIVSFLFGLFWFHVCFPGSFHVQLLGFVFPSRQSHPRVNYPSDKSGILKEIKVSGFRFSFVRWPVFLSLSTLY